MATRWRGRGETRWPASIDPHFVTLLQRTRGGLLSVKSRQPQQVLLLAKRGAPARDRPDPPDAHEAVRPCDHVTAGGRRDAEVAEKPLEPPSVHFVIGIPAVQSDLDRFLALIRRELGADDVRVLGDGQEALEDPCELRCRMTDGRNIGVRFASPPSEREATQRRLEMLASSFDAVAEDDPGQHRRSRPPVAQALRDELVALCNRAAALNAIVIDANSPVEWGIARPQGGSPLTPRASSTTLADAAEAPEEGAEGEAPVALASRRALEVVRGLPELAALRKGRHLRYVERTGTAPVVVHSFAGIYLLVLVFDAPLDELRAERAVVEALPRIERLVLALPPLDPSPHADVLAMRGRSRKR